MTTFLDAYRAEGLSGAEQVDLLHEWLGKDVHHVFAQLRAGEPILMTDGPVVVTRYPDVVEVLSHEKVFSVRLYGPKMDPCVGPYMLARDATSINERDKSVMQVMLRREDLPQVGRTVRQLAEQAIDDGLEGNRLEIVGNLSRKVPIQLCGAYFGFPGPDIATMMRWSRAANLDMFFNLVDDPEIHGAAVRAGTEMKAYVDQLIAARRAEMANGTTRDDILGRLLSTVWPEAIGFDDERIRANMMFMLIGGVETVSGAVVLALDELLRRPDALAGARDAALADDDEALSNHIWEALRLNPIFPYIVRTCEEDYTLAAGTERATTIPAGKVVYAAVGSAMLDEGQLEDPTTFRLDRAEHHRNLHFGYGHHLCLCYYLSLVEVPAILKALLVRGLPRRVDGAAGQVDTGGGPFAERLVVEL